MSAPVSTGPQASRRPGVWIAITICLAAPFVALLWVGSYAKTGPLLFGFPFFYWYQFLWVFLASALTYVAFVLIQREERRRRPARHQAPDGSPGGPTAGASR